jgi:hypothetical protein
VSNHYDNALIWLYQVWSIVEREVSVMEVASVSSSVNTAIAPSAQAQLRARQPEPDQQAPQSRQAQSSEQVHNSQSGDVRDSADSSRAEAERSTPSVNTNGQTVGTRANTTA